MEVRAWWSCGAGPLVVVVESAKKPVEVGLGVAPVERRRRLLVAALEGQQASFDLVQVGEVVGRQHFALHDREVDLDLVQPRRVHRQVDQAQVPPAAFQPVDRGLAAVGAAIVDDPEHPLGRGVGLGSHDLGDQPAEWVDARGGLHAAEQVGVVDIPGGQVRQRSTAVVFVLHAHTARRACWPVAWQRQRAWTWVFSSAESTYSSSPSSWPWKLRWYRSRTRLALAAKSGARGKIHEWYRHGLMASSASQRPSVVVETASTSPLPMTSVRNS